ncbi:beta-1,3-galactosyltransferase 5-like [Ruditapes philippinarum]|uniref:beta-1,3-galactosyltransferase 5-like n=1 Tax=Ruditapes philippinarum TaxID=129788 RepID=UPI00295BB74E|nr:beta-1,3-galactosyltransferase 5-like [Ruditapes philippinarum]
MMKKKFRCRLLIIKISFIVIVSITLPFACRNDVRDELKKYCINDRLRMIINKHNGVKEDLPYNSIPVIKTGLNSKYDFERELEFDRKDRFERRKEEMLFKLERRKAHVYDRSIDIDEPLPAIEEEIKKMQSYYNMSKSKLTVLNSKFLIENKSVCSEVPELIVLIPSIPSNGYIRTAIRSTYGLIARYTPSDLQRFGMQHPVQIAFLLGRSPNQSVDYDVRKEQRKHSDIVQADFIDSYYNLTLKVLYGLKWVNTYCQGVRYVLKADEDVFVNIQLLLAELRTYRVSTKGSVFGFIHSSYYGLKVLKTGKWGVNESEYPLRRYPPYAQGTSYTITGNLVPKIVEIAQHLPYLHIEDAFITGIIAGKILGANLERINGNSFWTEEAPDPCEFVKTERVSQTNMKPSSMYKTWQALLSPDTLCANSTYRPRTHRYNWNKAPS